MSVTTAAESAPAANTPREPPERQPADRHQGQHADAPLPFADPCQPLWLPRHDLEQRRIDRAERHVVRTAPERALELRMIVRAHPQAHAGPPQRREVRTREVALAEMHEVAAFRERELPVIVDHQLHAGGERDGPRGAQLCAQYPGGRVLDAQLHQTHA